MKNNYNHQSNKQLQKMQPNLKNKKYQCYIRVILGLMIGLTGITIGLSHYPNTQEVIGLIGLFMTVLLFSLLHFSFRILKEYYVGVIDEQGPLFVPRVYGIGFTINPYHKIGRIIWQALTLMSVVLFIWMLIDVLF